MGAACGSTGWVASIGLAGQYMAGWLSDEAQREIFNDGPDQLITCVPTPGGKAVRDGGDWILSGKWPFSSGSLNFPWLGQGAVVGEEDGKPVIAYAVFPAAEATRIDTWHTSGLAGTGSVTVVADAVRVPNRRVIRADHLIAERYHQSSNTGKARWNVPWIPALSAGSLGAPLGIARGAVSEFLEYAPGRPITYTPHTDRGLAPPTHVAFGEAASKLFAAEALAHSIANMLDHKAEAAEGWTLEERARIRTQTAYAVRLCLECVTLIFDNSGASAIHKDIQVQRSLRDIRALANHALLTAQSNYELYGRVRFGGEALTPYI